MSKTSNGTLFYWHHLSPIKLCNSNIGTIDADDVCRNESLSGFWDELLAFGSHKAVAVANRKNNSSIQYSNHEN